MRSTTNPIATTYVADVMHRKAVFVNPRHAITAAGNLMVLTKTESTCYRTGRSPFPASRNAEQG